MKVLEILSITLKNGGYQFHQITHQEGWDFQNTDKTEGYVRWVNVPTIGHNICIYIRGGHNRETDFEILEGTIDFQKITNFFNSEETPLDLQSSNGKRSIETFNEKDLEDMKKDLGGNEYVINHGLRTFTGYLICDLIGATFLSKYRCPNANEDEIRWLLERFTWKPLPKVEVEMTCVSELDITDIKVERRTWTLFEIVE